MQKQRPFSVKRRRRIYCGSSAKYFLADAFSSVSLCSFFLQWLLLMRLLLLCTMEPVARKLLTCYWILFPCGNGPSSNFLTNLPQHFLYQLFLRHVPQLCLLAQAN